MTSRGWILAFKTSQSKMTQYWFEKSKSSAEADAQLIRSKGWIVVSIYQSPANAIVITKEETT